MSFKTIAVPTRTATRKHSAPGSVATPAYVPVTSAPVAARATRGRSHRFAVGQRLAMAAGGREISRGGSTCTVIFQLPYEGAALRYRVRSDNESFERIVDENDLSLLPIQP